MSKDIKKYLKKHGIEPQEIMYFTKEGRKTLIHLRNGKVVDTFLPTKYFYEVLEDQFLSVNKGVLLSKEHIVKIENGMYVMSDHSKHKGRIRTPGQHKKNQAIYYKMDNVSTESIKDAFSMLDTMPLACFVVDIKNGYNICFCNEKCNESGFFPTNEIENAPFFDLINEENKQWKEWFQSKNKTIHDYRREDHFSYTIHCFQPAPNYCACILIEK